MNKFNKLHLEEIPVVFSCDDNYIPYLTVAIKSLIDNSSDKYFYLIYIFHNGISVPNQNVVRKFNNNNVKIQFINVKRKLSSLTKNLHLRDYYSESIYFRLFIPSIFKDYDKVIYLDSDMVILDDVSKLYHIDLKDNLVAAVSDAVVALDDNLKDYVVNYVGVDKAEDYFNSGMLVMNVKAFKDAKIEERFIHLLNTYCFSTVAPDQDYLNALCKNRVLHLPSSWNKMMMDSKKEDELHIVHYNMFLKPWLYKGVRYEDYFWKYAVRTPFYFSLKQGQVDYSKEKQQEDLECSKKMVESALEFLQDDNSFKNVLALQEAK